MAKIFVSYSRKNSVEARKIIQALKDMNQDVWVDWEDIPPASDWLEQIFQGIEGSDAFIFLISPDSAASEVCKVEVGHAAKNNKRIIPVVVQQVAPQDTIDSIRKLNWTFMHEEDMFEGGIQKVKIAIELDFEWVEEHSRLQNRALEWDRKKESSLLLRGKDLRDARLLVIKAQKKDPIPSELQKTYIYHSNNNERRNIILIALAAIAVITMAFLSYAAVQQKNIANLNAVIADQQREVAKLSEAQAIQNARDAKQAQKKAEYEKEQANQARAEADKAREEADKERQKAEVSRNIAAAQRSAARAQIYQYRPGELYTSTLLAIDSWQNIESPEAEEILRKNISLLPIPIKQIPRAGSINALEFNAAGTVFLTAGTDGSTCAWQVSDGKNLFCTSSPGSINDAVFSPVENIIVTGDSQGNVQILSGTDGTVIKQISIGSPINDVDIQKSGRFAAVTSDSGKITLIDLKARSKFGIDLVGIKVKFATFTPDGLSIVSGSSNGVVSVWTLSQASIPLDTRKHNGEVTTLAFNPNGFYFVTGGADGAVVVTETKTGIEKFRVYHDDQVRDIAFNPNGSWFVTVSNDRKIRVWDINNGRQILSMSQNNFVQAVRVSPNGQWIATTGDDKTVRVWNASTGTELFQIPLKGKGMVLGFSKDGNYLIAGDQSGYINIWDISKVPTPTNYLQFNGVTASASYSPSGNLIAASDDKNVWLLNPKTLSKLTARPQGFTFPDLKASVTKLVFSSKDKWLAALTARNEIAMYNTQNHSPKTIKPDNLVGAFAFSPDEKQLLTGDSSGKLQTWDAVTGKLLNTAITYDLPITAMAVVNDVLAIGAQNELHILDGNTLKEIDQPVSQGNLELLVFSPDGSWLASSNSTGQIQIWEQVNGKFTEPKTINKEGVVSLAFDPSNNLLAIGAIDKVYLIDRTTLEEHARIPHTGTVNSVSFSSDGAVLMTSSLKVIQFWDISKISEIKKGNLIEIACQHLTENLSGEQWSTLFENERYRPLCTNLPVP
ncbi:MAG: TIR domain-containing protein [Chloroflexota bacterium]